MKKLEWRSVDGVITCGDYRVCQPLSNWRAHINELFLLNGTLQDCLAACQAHADEAEKRQRMETAYPLAIEVCKCAVRESKWVLDHIVERAKEALRAAGIE